MRENATQALAETDVVRPDSASYRKWVAYQRGIMSTWERPHTKMFTTGERIGPFTVIGSDDVMGCTLVWDTRYGEYVWKNDMYLTHLIGK